jgi:hypothetical protein
MSKRSQRLRSGGEPPKASQRRGARKASRSARKGEQTQKPPKAPQ